MILASILGLFLLLGMPAQALWPRSTGRPERTRAERYRKTIAQASMLSLAACAVALHLGLQPNAWGLSWPPPSAGQVGLLISLAAIIGLAAATLLATPNSTSVGDERQGLMPQNAAERRLFMAFALVIGFVWELLYRAYLLWWLEPQIGTVAAVALASLAYALAHGWSWWRPALGSLIAALLFTICYAVTRSLWWLALLHAALPLIGLLAFRRAGQLRHEDRKAAA